MEVTIAIPARMQSGRLPGKPLVEVRGHPLLWWAIRAARQSRLANHIIVCSDAGDYEIIAWCHENGVDHWQSTVGRTILTGSDRIAELVGSIDEIPATTADIFVNLQCDEPDITGNDLDQLVGYVQSHATVRVATLSCPLVDGDMQDRSAVKVVVDNCDRALYFTRSPLAGSRLHVGVYAYRRPALLAFTRWPQGRLETLESLEQLRLLENDVPIHVRDIGHRVQSINTHEDVERLNAVPVL